MAPGWGPIRRSTVSDPAAGSGFAREPTTLCVESAAKSLLAPTPITGMPPPPPPYPPPPPHAARTSTEDNITEAARSLRVRIVCPLSVTIRPTGTPANTRLTALAAAPFRPGQAEKCIQKCRGFALGRDGRYKAGMPLSPRAPGRARLYTYRISARPRPATG